MTANANTNAKGITLTLRDLAYFAVSAVGSYVVTWQAAGSPTDPKALASIAIGLLPVVFRKVFPNLGEATPATPAPTLAAPVVLDPAPTPAPIPVPDIAEVGTFPTQPTPVTS